MLVNALVLATCSRVVVAEDPALEDILNNSRAVKRSVIEGEDTQVPMPSAAPEVDDDMSWLKGRSLRQTPSAEVEGDTQQQRAWQQIMEGTSNSEVTTRMGDGPPRPPVPDDVMYVYISLSMPDETIRALFHQALANKDLRSVVFVLRGWQPPGPNRIVGRLNALFPEAQNLRELPNVQIDPNLYEQQGISVVPTFTTKDQSGRWGTVVGSTSIADAISRIESNRYDGQVIGPTFDIEEPNVLEMIRQRIAAHDWTADVERVKQSLLTKTTTGQALPAATQNESYLVDLTIVNNRALQGPTGEVFAAAGSTVNPFDYMTTQKRYIFVDANDERQLAQALAWRKQFPYTTIITTIPLQSVAARSAAINLVQQPIYEINQTLIQRFKLKAVPSMAYQDGRMLRVDVVAVRDTVAANTEGAH
jgi:type-F conjugative transfer system pilin assembly protein TrbC